MQIYQKILSLLTKGRGFIEITSEVSDYVNQHELITGICHVFLAHTSASLIFCENADPTVLKDLEKFIQRLVPDGDSAFMHNAEGVDDMPAHIRTVLTQNSLSIPIVHGNLALGRWQGLFLWEHRLAPHQRQVTMTLIGQQKT